MRFANIECEEARRVLQTFFQEEFPNHSLQSCDYQTLTGGRSGAGVTRFCVGGQDLVLRMFSPHDDRETRKREATLTHRVGAFGIAPKVYFVDPEYHGMVIEFIDGIPLSPQDVTEKEDLLQFGKFLKRVHSLPIAEPCAPTLEQIREKWMRRAVENHGSFPSFYAEIEKVMIAAEQILCKNAFPSVLTHQDLLPLNILKMQSSYRLIDWPNGGVGDPFCDLATFPDFHNLNETQIGFFLEGYFGREASEHEWDLFVCHRPFPLFWRSIGGLGFAGNPDRCTLDQVLAEGRLPPIRAVMEDVTRVKLGLDYWELSLILLTEVKQQIGTSQFIQSLERLQV